MTRILLTLGPIPARVDSVKYITNRFKGGLALKTAEALYKLGHKVTLVAWEHQEIDTRLKVIRVRDVYDYYEKVLATQADAYILAAAVANLTPVTPFVGKFPSHNYKVGDVFPIDFTIAPRTIDDIKKKYPNATLVGYKLYDGEDDELIRAARKTLMESRANVVFANHPKWAKVKKIVITADGAAFPVSFKDHISLIDSLLKSKFYRTEIIQDKEETNDREAEFVINHYPKYRLDGMVFGTFAVRSGKGFLTTTRGKRAGEKAVAFVQKVDHQRRIVYANQKATLNAPLLDKLFKLNPQIKFLVHGHDLVGKRVQSKYQFPGTDGDLKNCISTKQKSFLIQLPYHGYIAGFRDFEDCQLFIKKHHVE